MQELIEISSKKSIFHVVGSFEVSAISTLAGPASVCLGIILSELKFDSISVFYRCSG
jgi:hypothetical protein